MKNVAKSGLVALALCMASTFFTGETSHAVPLPWPFPWSRQCPMEWTGIEGRYHLVNQTDGEQIELRIDNHGSKGNPQITMWRLASDGTVNSVGMSDFAQQQSEVHVYMVPSRGRPQVAYWASIRMYTAGQCSADAEIVPILELRRSLNDRHPQLYQLQKEPQVKN
jgi:hypothetical protein